MLLEFEDAAVRLVELQHLTDEPVPDALARYSRDCSDCASGRVVVVVVLEWRAAPCSVTYMPLCGLCFVWRACAKRQQWLAKVEDPALDVARVLSRAAPGGIVRLASPKQDLEEVSADADH